MSDPCLNENSTKDLDELIDTTWKTCGTRFNASSRLKKKSSAQLWCLTILSFFSISYSVIPLFFCISEETQSVLSFLSFIFSIAVLSLSFYTASTNDDVNSFEMLSCGKKVSKLNKKLRALKSKRKYTHFEVEHIREQYDAAIDSCSCNHIVEDFLMFQIRRQGEIGIKYLPKTKIEDIKRYYNFCEYSPYYITIAFIIMTNLAVFIYHFK